ncbi:hypothetical protein J8353_17185, partial [Escherichia coli]|nr:hypothetical protein [Escherichia coli]
AEFTIGEGELMAHDVPLGCAPDEYDDLISGTCSHLPWKFWFLGSIPWERKTVTPASLWHHPGLVLIHAEGVETPQPELTEAV